MIYSINMKHSISGWHCIEHRLFIDKIIAYKEWANSDVGLQDEAWKWNEALDDSHYFICFRSELDATAFKLRFQL